jgi:hypothetical protein
VGLEASLGNSARNSFNPLYNFRVFQINASITDSSGNVFQLTPTTVATSVWDTPYQTGINVDYAQLIGDLSTWLVGLVGVPTPPNIAISQFTPNGNYIVANTLIGQWTAYPNGCIIDSAFHNTCNGNGGGLYDKVLRIRFVPTFSTPDVYKISIGTRVERGGCYQNTVSANGAIAYTDYCITEETLTQNYSFSYVYENDAGLGLGDTADSLPKAGGNPFFVQHGSYTGFLYGIDTADVYSFTAAQAETIAFVETPPQTADFSLSIFDTTQALIQKQDLGPGATTGISFVASVTGTYFAQIGLVSGWGLYSFSLTNSFQMSASPGSFSLGLAGTVSSGSSTITVASPKDFAGRVYLGTSISPNLPNGPAVSVIPKTYTLSQNPTSVVPLPTNPTQIGGYPVTCTSALEKGFVQDNVAASFIVYDGSSTNTGTPNPCGAKYSYLISLPTDATVSSVQLVAVHQDDTYGTTLTVNVAPASGTTQYSVSPYPSFSTFATDTVDITAAKIDFSGGSVSVSWTVSGPYGLGGADRLDWLGLKVTYSTISVSLTPGSSDTRTVTISSTASTPPATYTITLTGTSTGIVFSVPVTVFVQDFQVTATPTFLTIPPGQSSSTTITVSPLNGFTGSVALFVSAPARFTTGFSTNVISGGSGTSLLTISLSGTPTPDPATITVSGISGGRSQSATITVLNPPPDFSVSASPNPVTLTAGTTNTFTVNVGGLYGFTGSVSLTLGIPPSLTCSALSSSTVTLTSTSTSGRSTLSCSGPAGVYGINVTGTSGSISHFRIIAITVQDFSISASPTSVTVLAGASAGSTINTVSFYGFAGTVSLSVSVSPAGLTCTLSATSIVGSGSSSLLCRGGAGVYTVTVTGTSGSLVHSAIVAVTLQDFSISPSASTVAVVTGQTATSTINIASLNGFAGTVSLSDTPLPTGLTCGAISPTSVTLPPSPGTATLSCTATAPGTYTVTVLASSGSLSHSTTVSLSFVGDFSISPNSPLTYAYWAGTWCSASPSPTVTALNGFTGTITLTANPSAGLSVSLNPSSITLSSTVTSGTSNWSFFAASPGTYTWTVTASSGSLSHQTAVMTIMIADFHLSVPNSLSVAQGSSVSSLVNVTAQNWWNGAVTLSTSAPPSGASASLNPTSVSVSNGGTASSTLTITPTCHTTPGTYALTITGTGTMETHSGTISVGVTSSPACTPIINTIPNQAVTEKQQLSYQVTGYDPDGDPVTFSLGYAPTGASISSQGLFTWTPADGSDGSYWVLVYASDPYGGLASQWFLVTVNEAENAQFVSWTPPPAIMARGSQATVSVTMMNSGTSMWQPASFNPPNPFRLGSQSPQDNTNWGIYRIDMSQPVAPGAQYTFTFVITAPNSAGIYNFQWRMVQEWIEWFGDYSPNQVVTVPGFTLSSCGTTSLTVGGSSGSCTITVSSVGGFSGTVNLALSGGSTGGPSASLSPTSVSLASSGSASAAVSLVSGSSSGYFYFTVTGTSGSQVTSVTFNVYQYVPGGGGGGGCCPRPNAPVLPGSSGSPQIISQLPSTTDALPSFTPVATSSSRLA